MAAVRLASFDAPGDRDRILAATGGCGLDASIFTDRPVLRVDLELRDGWRQDVLELSLRNLETGIPLGARFRGIEFQMMATRATLDQPGWARCTTVLRFEGTDWVQAPNRDLREIRPRRWTRLSWTEWEAAPPRNQLPTDLSICLITEHRFGGSLYFADFSALFDEGGEIGSAALVNGAFRPPPH